MTRDTALLIVFVIAVATFMYLGFDKRGLPWGRKRRIFGDIVENPKLLDQAENEVRAVPRDRYVVAYSFDPIHIYTESFMIQLVNDLWENGVDAIYDQLPAPVGNLKAYSIKCPPDQVSEARELITRRLQDGFRS